MSPPCPMKFQNTFQRLHLHHTNGHVSMIVLIFWLNGVFHHGRCPTSSLGDICMGSEVSWNVIERWHYLWLVYTIIFVALILFSRNFFELFISLEYKYNELQFGLTISSFEVRRHLYRSLHCSCLQQNLRQRNPSSCASFFKSEGILGESR